MVGGALAGAPRLGQAGMGVAQAERTPPFAHLLAYRQSEESSADQAAMSFLNATKQSGRGMIETFEFMGSKLVGVQGINPYLQIAPPAAAAHRQSQGAGGIRAPTTTTSIRPSSSSGTT